MQLNLCKLFYLFKFPRRKSVQHVYTVPVCRDRQLPSCSPFFKLLFPLVVMYLSKLTLESDKNNRYMLYPV